jgi:hypothetical protein
MNARQPTRKNLSITQGKPVEEILRRAVRHALLVHKRAGNTIAAHKNGRIVLIPAHEIRVDDDEAERG